MQNYKVEKVEFNSTNNKNVIHGKIFIPSDEKIKGIVQISHGMCEYIEGYEDFAKLLLEHGYIVCGHSHIGHGDSVLCEEERGFFATKDGYKCLINDLHKMTIIIKDKYKSLPIFLLGHSMGSFIARCYISMYGQDINGVILLGTGGPNVFTDAAIKLADLLIKQKGELYRSEKLNNMALDVFNQKIKNPKTKFDWVSLDDVINKRCLEDKKSNFIFTVSGYKDLFNLVKKCNSQECIKNTPTSLPIYICSGAQDPVGGYGLGVVKVYQEFYIHGMKDLNFKIYSKSRHDILNDFNKQEVRQNILAWLDERSA